MNRPETIRVHRDGVPIYDIVFAPSFSELPSGLLSLGYTRNTKLMIVTDSNVDPLYLAEISEILCRDFLVVRSFTLPAGEAHKTLDSITDLYEALILEHFDRKDLLIALGGGVIGDMTGFAAATYLRGVDFIQVPTSLLAMVDSSVGGKTGVDFKGYKNMVGAFYMPKLVYMNPSVLATLPAREIACGMGEVIKYGISMDADFYESLFSCTGQVKACDPDTMARIVHHCCCLKRDVVEEDPTEQGRRRILNFGHTIGHAVEKLMNFSLLHGECVAVGMCAAVYLSMRRGAVSEAEYGRLRALLASYDLPVGVSADDISPQEVLDTLYSDKKTVGGRIRFVLCTRVGESFIDASLTDEELLDAIRTVVS